MAKPHKKFTGSFHGILPRADNGSHGTQKHGVLNFEMGNPGQLLRENNAQNEERDGQYRNEGIKKINSEMLFLAHGTVFGYIS